MDRVHCADRADAGPAAATLGKHDHWQAVTPGHLEQSILLVVATPTLGAGHYRVVVVSNRNAGSLRAKLVAVNLTNTHHDAVSGCCFPQPLLFLPAACCNEWAVLAERSWVEELINVLAGRALTFSVAPLHLLRARLV